MQLQSAIHRRPAYDKSHYQEEMARARQREKQMYPGMFKNKANFSGASSSSNVTSAGGNSYAERQRMIQNQYQQAYTKQRAQQQQRGRPGAEPMVVTLDDDAGVDPLATTAAPKAAPARPSSDIHEVISLE